MNEDWRAPGNAEALAELSKRFQIDTKHGVNGTLRRLDHGSDSPFSRGLPRSASLFWSGGKVMTGIFTAAFPFEHVCEANRGVANTFSFTQDAGSAVEYMDMSSRDYSSHIYRLRHVRHSWVEDADGFRLTTAFALGDPDKETFKLGLPSDRTQEEYEWSVHVLWRRIFDFLNPVTGPQADAVVALVNARFDLGIKPALTRVK